jgi:hypothetical protein
MGTSTSLFYQVPIPVLICSGPSLPCPVMTVNFPHHCRGVLPPIPQSGPKIPPDCRKRGVTDRTVTGIFRASFSKSCNIAPDCHTDNFPARKTGEYGTVWTADRLRDHPIPPCRKPPKSPCKKTPIDSFCWPIGCCHRISDVALAGRTGSGSGILRRGTGVRGWAKSPGAEVFRRRGRFEGGWEWVITG